MTRYNVNVHGYNESRLYRIIFAGPKEFVITEFGCCFKFDRTFEKVKKIVTLKVSRSAFIDFIDYKRSL